MIDDIASWASVRLMRLRSSMTGPNARPVMPNPADTNKSTKAISARQNGVTNETVEAAEPDHAKAWLPNHSGQVAFRPVYCAVATAIWAAANWLRQSFALSGLVRQLALIRTV